MYIVGSRRTGLECERNTEMESLLNAERCLYDMDDRLELIQLIRQKVVDV